MRSLFASMLLRALPTAAAAQTVERVTTQDMKIGEVGWRTYVFGERWEMAVGGWAFEFWYKGEKVGEKASRSSRPSAACSPMTKRSWLGMCRVLERLEQHGVGAGSRRDV